MTSQINPNNINGAYPVAGQDNNSQGFRDNFTNTSTNFNYAAQEITDLQNKSIVNSQLTGGANLSVQNNMLNSPLTNALVSDFAFVAVSGLVPVSNVVTIDYSAGHFQSFTTSGSVSLGFSNWPIAGQQGVVTVQITVASAAHTVTLPTAVSVNTTGIQGLNPSTNVITFAASGVYSFTFSTSSNGATISINQTNQELQPFNNSSESLAASAVSNLAVTTSYITTGSAETATLPNGVSGQIKTLVAANVAAGSMVVAVTSAGWNLGNTGNVTLSSTGSACTLQFGNGSWYCIGNNGVSFS